MSITDLHPDTFSPGSDDQIAVGRLHSTGGLYDPSHGQPWSEADVAVFLGVSERQVRVLRKEDRTFPPPARFIGSRPVWVPRHLRTWVTGEDFTNTELPASAVSETPAKARRRSRSNKSERALV